MRSFRVPDILFHVFADHIARGGYEVCCVVEDVVFLLFFFRGTILGNLSIIIFFVVVLFLVCFDDCPRDDVDAQPFGYLAVGVEIGLGFQGKGVEYW